MGISELRQRRAAIQHKIRENPTVITRLMYPMPDDGFGGQIPDPFGTPTEEMLTVRLSHETGLSVPKAGPVPAGESTNLQRFILADYQTVITEGELFEAIGKSWRVGAVDPLYASGGIIGYQAPLVEAADLPEGEVET